MMKRLAYIYASLVAIPVFKGSPRPSASRREITEDLMRVDSCNTTHRGPLILLQRDIAAERERERERQAGHLQIVFFFFFFTISKPFFYDLTMRMTSSRKIREMQPPLLYAKPLGTMWVPDRMPPPSNAGQ